MKRKSYNWHFVPRNLEQGLTLLPRNPNCPFCENTLNPGTVEIINGVYSVEDTCHHCQKKVKIEVSNVYPKKN